MKKILLGISMMLAIALISGVATSCAPDKGDGKDVKKSEVRKGVDDADLPNYRYVDIDSVLMGYNLAKDYNEQSMVMERELENTMRQKRSALESEAASLQRKYGNIQYPTALEQNQMQQEANNFQNRQSKAEKEVAALQSNYQKEMMDMQKNLMDSIESFIKGYNDVHHYDAIFTKQAGLYFDERLDITQEVIDGLNRRYNKK